MQKFDQVFDYDEIEKIMATEKRRTEEEEKPKDVPLMSARILAHGYFDKLWKSKRMTRSQAYAWMSNELNIPPDRCHIKQFDISTCNRVIYKLAVDFLPEV